jgi:anti-sigma factor RsiW
MRCSEVADLIDLYVDGALAEEQQARVERHLMRCGDCAFEVRTLEQTRSYLREALPVSGSSPSFREKMTARLNDQFADVLRRDPAPSESQWALPFLRESASRDDV